MLQLSFFFHQCRFFSATSSDQDLKGKGCGFGFWDWGFPGLLRGLIRFVLVFRGIWDHFSEVELATVLLGFCPRGANFSSVS